MTKHLHLKKVLAAVLTIAALATGQQAFATITETFTFKGNVQTVNNTNHYNFEVGTSGGIIEQLAYRPGTYHQFNSTHFSWNSYNVTLNGTLQFQVSNTLTDVVVQGSTFTVTFQSQSLWFYGASVKKLNGTSVTNSSVTVSSDKHTVTVTINRNGTEFGQIILDYVANPPMTNSNTTVTVPQGDYWVSNSSHKPKPEPTVVYGQTTLVKDTDYTLSWSNNSSAGTGTVTVTGIGNYAGSATGFFYIRWARYYVHFDKNHDDATGTMSVQVFIYNTAQALTDNTFSRTGYSFIGWSTTSNGAVTYTDGQSVSNLTAEDGQTVTLYAQWTLNYNITYDLDGGSVATPNPTTYNVTTPTFTLNNPTKVACNFDGWTGSNGNTPETTVTIAQGSTGDRSYTAQWTQYAYPLSLGTDITASGTVAFTYEGTDYFTPGTIITLAYGGTIPEGQHLVFKVNGNAIKGNTFEMPAADVVVDAVLLERYYIYNSTTGELALLWGEFNKDNKWGSEVTESAVTSVTATDEVSFTGDCNQLFYNFTSCTSMDLTDVNTANVTNMGTMFFGCSGLQSLNISGWNTANVTNMSNMFFGCSGLQSLDLSGWNTANVTDMSNMFRYCYYLATIYVGGGWSTSSIGSLGSRYMFKDCASLVGGMGTAYDAYHIDKAYARIDRGQEQPGYFTGRFTKEIAGYEDNESGWYLIASPLAADIAPTAVTNMTNETFDLYYFDQTGGTNGKEWKNWKNEGGDGYHFNLKTGKGYLYANSGNVTLGFTGVPYSGNGQVTLTKADGFEFSGWNLIGNPFSTAATLDKPFYRMNESGTALSAQIEANNSVAAMEGVFVQASTNNETATFTQANNSKGGEKDAVPMLTLNLTRNRGEAIDNAIVRFDGGHTLEKFSFREGSTKIYIPQDGTDYAIATSNGQGEMPLNFKATENGTYTLTISTTLNSQLSTLNYLHLIDNMTGADVDLLTPEPIEGPATYTFTAKTTDYASRFKLVFSANGNADGDNDAFAFIDASGNIIVNGEGTLQVIDVMGRIIVSHGGHTRCVPTTGLTAGVYVLRLIDGENVKTLKIVIS